MSKKEFNVVMKCASYTRYYVEAKSEEAARKLVVAGEGIKIDNWIDETDEVFSVKELNDSGESSSK